jgi:hypothetical protein
MHRIQRCIADRSRNPVRNMGQFLIGPAVDTRFEMQTCFFFGEMAVGYLQGVDTGPTRYQE